MRVAVNAGRVPQGRTCPAEEAGLADYAMHKSPRCGARTRAGHPCKSPAVRDRNGRCRMHGAYAGAPRGERNGMFRHGRRTIEAQEARQAVREMVQVAEQLTAVALHRAGLPTPAALKRRVHVKKAIAEAKKRKQGYAEAAQADTAGSPAPAAESVES